MHRDLTLVLCVVRSLSFLCGGVAGQKSEGAALGDALGKICLPVAATGPSAKLSAAGTPSVDIVVLAALLDGVLDIYDDIEVRTSDYVKAWEHNLKGY